MRSSRSVLLACQCVAAASLFGCQTPPPPPASPAPAVRTPTAKDAEQTQMQFAKSDPNVRVGHVGYVDTGDMSASVVMEMLDGIKNGDTVSFTDAKQNPVAAGTVRGITDPNPYRFLIVDYKPAPDGGRAPMKGDLAVWIPKGK